MNRSLSLVSVIDTFSSFNWPCPDVQSRSDSASVSSSRESVLLDQHPIRQPQHQQRLGSYMPKFLVIPSPRLEKSASELLLNQIPGRSCRGLPLSSTYLYRRHNYILQHHQQQDSSTSSWALVTCQLSSDTRCTKSAPKQTHSKLSARSYHFTHPESAFMYSCSDLLGPQCAKRKYSGKQWALQRIRNFTLR